jgi:hypothetical protein
MPRSEKPMPKMTRRLFAAMPAVAIPAATIPAASARAQAQTASAEVPVDLLERRRQNVQRSSEELRRFELGYTDEPLFRLIVR